MGWQYGIDTAAHIGAIEADGNTIAVLGCGFDNIFPKQNIKLFHEIIEKGGLIISEYQPDIKADSNKFIERNRIVSGLSIGVLVIEAAYRSGTSVTCKYAKEQGKKIFCIPHNLDNKHGIGTNRLIKQGAGIVESVEDFMADLDILTEMSYTQMDFRKNLLEKDERLVYSLTDFRPIGVATLVEKTGISISRLLEILEKLESLGLIKETFTNYYIRTLLN